MSELQIYNLDHLGLVAGIIDEMGLVEEINQYLGEDPNEKVSSGVVVKAMILNGLGILSAPLYLFSRFFEGKPTEHLLGAGVVPEYLNDDRLGRSLDDLWDKGLSFLFLRVALRAVKVFGVEVKQVHLDSTSFAVEGEYAVPLMGITAGETQAGEEQADQESGVQPIHIRRGYSRDHRPDLKQFVMNLICSGDGGIPLFLAMADGNQVDSQVFGGLMREFGEQWKFDGVHVADAAFYTSDNLIQMGTLQWVSRVPLTIGSASRLLDEIAPESFFASAITGYELSMVCNSYAEVNQHWVVVRSQARQDKDLQRLEAKLQKAQQQAQSDLQSLQKQEFNCPVLAQTAVQHLNDKLLYHQLIEIQTVDKPHYGKSGRPVKGAQPTHFTYQVRASLQQDTAVVEQQKRRAGCFILATPVLEDKPELSADEILRHDKDQQYPERGFRFCKDPMFFADSVFLKNPRRIEALSFIMGLCLLVYSLGQRYLRQALTQAETTLPNQLGKPTARPTLRWIFQCFQAVHLLVIKSVPQVVNLNPERLRILQFFPKPCLSYYLLC